MSDEAFARRFYSDRAELLALGVPLHSQRDEFTGEELYTLRSEQYFLPQLELEDEELAALQTALYLLEGKFAYAEPLRLALQNLALGRPGFAEAPTETALRVEVLDPDYSPEMPGRLAKLEGAISKQRTVKFDYWSISRDEDARAHAQPVRAAARQRRLVRRRPRPRPRRHPHVPRLAHPRRHQVRDAPRARLPHARRTSTSSSTAAGRRGRSATSSARRGSRCAATPPGGCSARTAPRGRLEDGVFVTEYSSLPQLASWVLRQDGRAVPLEPDELRREVAAALRRVRERHEGKAAEPAREAPRARAATAPSSARPGPVAPERFAVLQALLAYLLAACGEEQGRRDPGARAARALPVDPGRGARGAPLAAQPRQLRRRLLHGLRRAARRRRCTSTRSCGATRSGSPPRLTPLEARAIRLALEYVGPMIAADAHTPLDRVRKKLEETFGQFELAQTPEPHVEQRRGGSHLDARARRCASAGSSRSSTRRRSTQQPSTRLVEPYSLERAAAVLVRAHVGPRRATASARSGSTGCAARSCTREKFEPREGFEPTRLRDARTRAHALHAGDRALRDRARRAAARGRQRARASSRSAATSGSRARSSRSAARPSCSSRPSCARASPPAPRSSRRSSASSACACAPEPAPYFGMKLMLPLLSRMPHSTSSTEAIC